MAYSFVKPIIIDHTKCGSADSTNFQFLFIGTYSWLATVANGGDIQNSNLYDLVFTYDFAGTIPLSWEIEPGGYDPTTGSVIIWIKVPTLSHAADTVIYAWYGNAAISTFQSTGNVWPSYATVNHFGNSSGSLTADDSTGNGNNGIVTGMTVASAAKIGTAAASSGSSSNSIKLPSSSSLNVIGPITLEAWVYPTASGTYQAIIDRALSSGSRNYAVYLAPTVGDLYIAMGGTNNGPVTPLAPKWALNTWNYIVVTHDGASSLVVYVNGAVVYTATVSTPPTGSALDVYFGSELGNTFPLTGRLDEGRVFLGAKSASLVLAQANNQSDPSTFFTVGSVLSLDILPHDLSDNRSHFPFVISASSFLTSFEEFRALDGSVGTYWLGTNHGVDWYQVYLSEVYSATTFGYAIKVNNVPEPTRGPKNFTLKGSNDGSTWTTLDTRTNETSWTSGEIRTYNLASTSSKYRYFRLDITANNGDATYTQLAEFYIYGSLIRDQDFAPHNLTSNTSNSPFVASASSFFSFNDAFRAFDGSVVQSISARNWLGSGGGVDWLQLDTGGSYALVSYAIASDNELTRAPKTWTMQGSNNGSTWTTLDTRSAETSWQNYEVRRYTCSVTGTAYRYFRLNITANNGDATYTQVGELYLFKSESLNVTKANAYIVVTTPPGLSVTKSLAYAVVTTPPGVSVTKANAYVVLSTVLAIQQPITFIAT